MRPWLLLDVDDVLVWHKHKPGKDDPPHCRHPEHRHLVKRTIGVRHGHVDPAAGPRLRRVAERAGAELGWGTGMGPAAANMYIAPLTGLPHLPGAPMPEWPGPPGEGPPDGAWKCLNVIAWLASPAGRAGEQDVDECFSDLLEQSSLGTPAARQIRERAGRDVVGEVRRRVRTEEMRPFAWLDNDPEIPAYLADTHGLPPYKVVTVDPWTALTDEHLAEAEEWLASLPDSKSREN